MINIANGSNREKKWIAPVAIVSSDATNTAVAKLLLDKRDISVITIENLKIDKSLASRTIGFLLDQGNMDNRLYDMFENKMSALKRIGGTAIIIIAKNPTEENYNGIIQSNFCHRTISKPFDGYAADQILKIIDMRC